MYLRYFGFESFPFAVTPDPAFLYLSSSHREALAHLLYGAGEHGGFVSLIGEVGTGKTTLVRALADSHLENLDIALCWNPQLSVHELVATICDELSVMPDRPADTSRKVLLDRLNAHLLQAHAQNRRTVLVIDEAQNLSRDVLEQLRLLTNLETHKQKLLRIILVGQPELADLLARRDLRQLDQRITARFVLRPLGYADTRAYVVHRLKCANGPERLFSKTATTLLRTWTGGVPRLINMVCDRALMGAYAHQKAYIGSWTIMRAAMESLPRRGADHVVVRWRLALASLVVIAGVLACFLAWWSGAAFTNAGGGSVFGASATPVAARRESSTSGNVLSSTPAKASTTAAPTAGVAAHPSSARDAAASLAPNPSAARRASVSVTSGPDSAGRPAAIGGGHLLVTPAGAPTTKLTASNSHPIGKKAGEGSIDPATTTVKTAPSGQSVSGLPDGDADMNQLLRLWGVFGARVHSDCRGLHVGNLRCLASQGDLAMVRRFNRPALVELTVNGQQHVLLLTAINDKTATLVGSDGARTVPIAELRNLWSGRFRVVWRSDSGARLVQPGSVGRGVVWLRRRLNRIDGDNIDRPSYWLSPIYDQALGNRLKTFQKVSGLKADGIAGPRTQMMLNSAVPSPGTPELQATFQNG